MKSVIHSYCMAERCGDLFLKYKLLQVVSSGKSQRVNHSESGRCEAARAEHGGDNIFIHECVLAGTGFLLYTILE